MIYTKNDTSRYVNADLWCNRLSIFDETSVSLLSPVTISAVPIFYSKLEAKMLITSLILPFRLQQRSQKYFKILMHAVSTNSGTKEKQYQHYKSQNYLF